MQTPLTGRRAEAAHRRPRLPAPREGRRAVRALRHAPTSSKATASSTRSRRTAATARRSCEHRRYSELVEPHRAELRAHCYRMLGSAHDADDALQEALLRAWRALAALPGRSSVRSWLYQIATNTCLDQIAKRPKQRVLPIDYGPPSDPHEGPGAPLTPRETVAPGAHVRRRPDHRDHRLRRPLGASRASGCRTRYPPRTRRTYALANAPSGSSRARTAWKRSQPG